MHTDYSNFTNVDTSDYRSVGDEMNSNHVEPITAEFHDVVEDIAVEPTTDKTKMGKVICGKLYLRSEPSTESKEVTILNKDEEIMIVSENDEEWYGVYTAAGQEGFCKKEFIKVD